MLSETMDLHSHVLRCGSVYNPKTLQDLCSTTIAKQLKTFNAIDTLELPATLKIKLKEIRKCIEIRHDLTEEIFQRYDELLEKSPDCGCNENYTDFTLKYFNYYYADGPEKCACLGDCRYRKYFPEEEKAKRICKGCAIELYERHKDQINVFELDKRHRHDQRYGAGLKLVEKEQIEEFDTEFTKFFTLHPRNFCDNCMCTMWEVTINKKCICELHCNRIQFVCRAPKFPG